MNIFRRLTLQTLKKNKTRTIVTIIGVMLSTAMITAVMTFGSSMQNQLVEITKATEGDWYAASSSPLTKQEKDRVKEADGLESLGTYEYVGYAEPPVSEEESNPYWLVAGFDKSLIEMSNLKLTEGRFPEKSTEIIVPKKLGLTEETITIPVGDRLYSEDRLYQYDEYEEGEEFAVRKEKTYRIVGTFDELPLETWNSPATFLITAPGESEDPLYGTYVTTEKAKDIYSFADSTFGETHGAEYHDELLMFMGVSDNDNFNTVLKGLMAILIIIIMAGSISLIYNAFSISVSERTKQFGLLSSVGATRKQLKKSVLFESLFISSIGIPLGLLAGIGGIAIVIKLIGNLMKDMISYLAGDMPFSVHVSPLWLVAAALIALITVVISAYIPSVRASKVPAIEAVRQTKDIKIKSDKVKTSKTTYKLFGLPGTLASKNFKRNKKRYRSTVISLTLSIVLFIAASTFSSYLNNSVNTVFGASDDYEISYGVEQGSENRSGMAYARKVKEDLSKAPGVENSTAAAMMYMNISDPAGIMENISVEDAELLQDITGEEGSYMGAMLCILDDDSFAEFAEDAGVDLNEYTDPQNPKTLLVNELSFYDASSQRYRQIPLSKTDDETEIKLSANEKEYTVPVGDFVSEMPVGASDFGFAAVIITNEEVGKSLFGQYDNLLQDYGETMIYFNTENPDKTYAEMEKICEEKNYDDRGLQNQYEQKESVRNMLLIINILTYGFTILLSLIATANVFNTISTNILLRKREFAMLNAVGLGKKGFRKMMNFECLLYGIKALIYGIPISVFISWLIQRVLSEGIDMGFLIPWRSLLIAVAGVFIIVFVTMFYSMRKVNKENIIDALRDETA